ncbi:MAG: zinc ribbon domain-containing protein [Ruminococcus sp.]|nr:zinc ribbon domain-containing protein [Ruminococcus sp.]
MAMIKCPECGREISDRAASCPNCGVPIASGKKVKIKMPKTAQMAQGWIGLLSSKKAVVYDSNGDILWSRDHGHTASFEIDNATKISIDLGKWGKVNDEMVFPGKNYVLLKDYGVHMVANFKLSEVDIIDAD